MAQKTSDDSPFSVAGDETPHVGTAVASPPDDNPPETVVTAERQATDVDNVVEIVEVNRESAPPEPPSGEKNSNATNGDLFNAPYEAPIIGTRPDGTPIRKRGRPPGGRNKANGPKAVTDAPDSPFKDPAKNGDKAKEPDGIQLSSAQVADTLTDLSIQAFDMYLRWRVPSLDIRKEFEVTEAEQKNLTKAVKTYVDANPVKLTPEQNLIAVAGMIFAPRVVGVEMAMRKARKASA